MINIGNFFFRYRNLLFIFLYLLLFIPSPPIFAEAALGGRYYYWPITIGLLVTLAGQVIRGATIGLAYIIRGGKDGRVYAESLVTTGIFSHCRNPLYLGNILMLLGVGILSNSLIYVAIVIPFFLFIYQAIVLAEENFLKNKFGDAFNNYCQRVNRWIPSLVGIVATFRSMRFYWKRWLIKEYNTQFIWLSGITLILLFRYPQLTNNDDQQRNLLLATILPLLLLYYLTIRYLKKSGKWTSPA
ncbi:isoprenylcysteine carboxylmethyltransferase family protein [Paraflavitalea sp. CAU 1676]|uniref:methyltransferase family protein n=1 Tax=Paraflavitalea sp. CAU 1676 TaxID=3032598 RepID=UPI0023DC4663|nr:isoprenylcysteine carboxylmethyltransferase family protein [Paraflavitalea sp. CAU 1676]MDF2193186.1 isoprenylcysteine carboxylmethyltransferase family protein [Paraflavitalea sp. CAU 1676]